MCSNNSRLTAEILGSINEEVGQRQRQLQEQPQRQRWLRLQDQEQL
ncbi:hypothetical protein ACXX82_02845 [Glaciimonas sp. GNP009]